MKTSFLLPVALLCATTLCSQAQFVQNEWGFYFGEVAANTTSLVHVRDIETDPSGNIFACGQFRGTVDFDPGSGTVSLTSGNFINGGDSWFAKYTSAGALIWVKTLTTNTTFSSATAMTVDDQGDIYVGGSMYGGSLDLDPNAGTFYTATNSSVWTAKYTSNGDFVWGYGTGNSSSPAAITDMFINAEDRLVRLATSSAPSLAFLIVDRSNGGVWNSYSTGGNGAYYLLDGQSGTDRYKATQDANGYYAVTGTYTGVIDPDVTPAQHLLVSSSLTPGQSNSGPDVFLSRYSSDMTLQWAFTLGATNGGGLYSSAIETDVAGNIYLAGTLMDTIDFDPGTGTTLLYPDFTINGRGFVAKYSSSGALIWAKLISKTESMVEYERSSVDDIRLSADGNSLYYISRAIFTNDYDPSETENLIFPIPNTVPDGVYSTILGNMDLDGNLITANTVVPSGNNQSAASAFNCLWVDGSANAYVGIGEIYRSAATGHMNMSFGACENDLNTFPTNMQSQGASISKYSSCNSIPTITQQPLDTVGCLGMNLTLEIATAGTTCSKYHWMKLTNTIIDHAEWTWASADPTLTFTDFALADTGLYVCTVEGECGSVTSNVFHIGSRMPVNLNVNSSAYQVELCEGDDHLLDFATYVSVTAGDGPISYEWQTGGSTLSASTQLSLTAVQSADAGIYHGIATNLCNTDTVSVEVVVNPTPALPTISQNGNELSSSYATGNQWYLEGNAIPNANGQHLTATVGGNYTVTHTDEYGCMAESQPYAVSLVGISDEEGRKFSVAPNPSSGLFTVSFQEAGVYQLSIIDPTGKLVLRTASEGVDTRIDLSEWSKGVYLLTVTGADTTQQVRLIKN